MENSQQHLEALQDIRQMMKQSNKFLSLSGLSGIFAGLYALIGAYIGNELIHDFAEGRGYTYASVDSITDVRQAYNQVMIMCVLVCIGVLGMSILTALFFSGKKAKRNGYKLFDHTALRLLINMLIPLAAGGIFSLAMLYHGRSFVLLIGPAMLIFYGLALVNGSKYTLNDIRYLGCLQILLGVVSLFYLKYSIFFWAFGFGVLHIIYGAYMWFKYDRKY
ncbi:MAG: hypothetical protein K0S32_3971 [Bacteroidetes bacterium]|jgi:hypothetical protein|nr:hypothetical protein [Bacteroidota bacterium]